MLYAKMKIRSKIPSSCYRKSHNYSVWSVKIKTSDNYSKLFHWLFDTGKHL